MASANRNDSPHPWQTGHNSRPSDWGGVTPRGLQPQPDPNRLRSRTLNISRIAAYLALLALAGCATTPPSQVDDACAIFQEKPDWYAAARQTEMRWGTPVQVQLAIIRAESSFRHDAKPPRDTFVGIPVWWRVSSAYGYAQAKDETWDSYRSATGQRWASRSDFEDASDFVGWYTDQTQKRLNISKWDTYNQYLAYHEGQGGYSRKTYAGKDWLIRIAKKVDGWARRYGGQLQACRPRLEG